MEKYSINLYDKNNNFIAQYPGFETFELAHRNVIHFKIYFNDICECNKYKYVKGYTLKDVAIVSIVEEEEE